MTGTNAMSGWAEIACQRGHGPHTSRRVQVSLGGPTAYADLTSIPLGLARSFDMRVWDPDLYPVDGGHLYCPAHDCVSETIANLGVWAPDESTLVLSVLDGHQGERFFDFGAQIGWFTLLAASTGAKVTAFEADRDNLELLRRSAQLNGWTMLVTPELVRIDEDTEPLPPDGRVRLVKVDVEGAEDEVVRVLRPLLAAGMVDHLLIEVSPVFADYYPEMVVYLVDLGFEAFVLPDKQRPPVDLADPDAALVPYRVDTLGADGLRAWVASVSQVMMWFKRKDAAW